MPIVLGLQVEESQFYTPAAIWLSIKMEIGHNKL